MARLRRQASLTQAQLAEHAGISISVLTKLERGERTSVSLATLHALARVLDVETSALLAHGGPLDRSDNGETAALIDLRSVLVPAPLRRHTVEAPNLADLRQEVVSLTDVYQRGDYASALALAPDLVRRADAAVEANTGDLLTMAHRLQSRAYFTASLVLLQLRQEDLSYQAAMRAYQAGNQAGDELLAFGAIDTVAWLFTRQARLVEAEETAKQAAESLEPRGEVTDVHLGVYGRLLTRASSSAARNNRPDASSDYLRQAREVATRMQSDHMTYATFGAAFGPTTVDTIEVENAMVMGEADRALFLAGRVRRGDAIRLTTWNRHLLTIAEAQAAMRANAAAVRTLTGINGVAPQWFRQQRLSKRLVRQLQDGTSVRWSRANGLHLLAEAIR